MTAAAADVPPGSYSQGNPNRSPCQADLTGNTKTLKPYVSLNAGSLITFYLEGKER